MTEPILPGDLAARPPFRKSRWKFSRSDSGPVLVIADGARERRYPMGEDEAWMLTQGIDRVMSWSASSTDGTFTDGLTPSQAAAQLAIRRYRVTSGTSEIHTRMAQATPWANWIEEDWTSPEIAWKVDVFAADDAQFLSIAMVHGVTVEEFSGDPAA